jgi:hypothetical protein
MLKRFFGIHLFAVAVTAAAVACGDTADVVVPTPVAQSMVGATVAPPPNETRATVEPTPEVIAPTAGITAEATEATRSAEFEAQLARGWPTIEGFAQPTPTPTKAPVDKSDWTTITPPPCDSPAAGEVVVDAQADTEWQKIVPTKAIGWFVDLSRAADESKLIDMADLIIHGVPVGDIEVEPARSIPDWLRYYQDVRILGVLKGQVSDDTVRVLQLGEDFATRKEYLEKYKTAIGSGGYEWPGPLNQCPQILFLNGPSAGVFPSVGLTQGIFPLGLDDRVVYSQEFESFVGMDVAQVKQRVEVLAQP